MIRVRFSHVQVFVLVQRTAGCGGNEDTDPHKQNCELVMQFMCEPDQVNAATGRALKHNINLKMEKHTRIIGCLTFVAEDILRPSQSADYLRNGRETGTQNYQQVNQNEINTNQRSQYVARRTGSVLEQRVSQETFEWYDKCFVRERNQGEP